MLLRVGKPTDGPRAEGAILLGKGRFELSEPLRLSADGIVIRGAGRQATVLYKKGVDRGAVVYIEGKSGIVTGDSIPLSDVRVGDRVVVVRPSTKQWIHLLGCDNFGGGGDLGYWGWHPGEIDAWTRTVTAVGTSENQNGGVLNAKNGGFIGFDVPLTMTPEQLGHVRLMRIKADGRLKNSGIENLTIDCATDSSNPKDENHAWGRGLCGQCYRLLGAHGRLPPSCGVGSCRPAVGLAGDGGGL